MDQVFCDQIVKFGFQIIRFWLVKCNEINLGGWDPSGLGHWYHIQIAGRLMLNLAGVQINRLSYANCVTDKRKWGVNSQSLEIWW
jgi:hypothetical protein